MLKSFLKLSSTVMLFFLIMGISAYITLSLIVQSEDNVVIPDLRGKEVVFALETLTDMGLATKVEGSEYSNLVPKNHIIFQHPEPGNEIKRGRDVRIVLSKGTRSIVMPNLTGMSIYQAKLILEENDLCQGNILNVYDNKMGKDNIIAHFPMAGSKVRRDKCINILISQGNLPKYYKMPDLLGISVDDAILALDARNLKIGEIKSVHINDEPYHIVTEQNPAYGKYVTKNSQISLCINRPARGPLKLFHGVGLFRYRIPSGFLKRRILVRMSIYGVVIHMFDDFMKPGEEIWFIVPYDADATVLVYQDEELIESKAFYEIEG